MSFSPVWTEKGDSDYNGLKKQAESIKQSREKRGQKKASKQEKLFKQVHKCLQFLLENPRHPGLETHEYDGFINPYDPNEKVFEAYAQQKTPAAYRVFWCYGRERGQITIIAITSHP